jgi:D-alanine-D-alanine ligase-like ATP-grasp enzyme
VRVLEARVREATGRELLFTVIPADALPMSEYGALIAEVYSGSDDFPVVLVDGRIVSANGIDPDAVVGALVTP